MGYFSSWFALLSGPLYPSQWSLLPERRSLDPLQGKGLRFRVGAHCKLQRVAEVQFKVGCEHQPKKPKMKHLLVGIVRSSVQKIRLASRL